MLHVVAVAGHLRHADVRGSVNSDDAREKPMVTCTRYRLSGHVKRFAEPSSWILRFLRRQSWGFHPSSRKHRPSRCISRAGFRHLEASRDGDGRQFCAIPDALPSGDAGYTLGHRVQTLGEHKAEQKMVIRDRPPRGGLSTMERFATFTTLPYPFEPRSRLFGSHLTRSQAGTTLVRGCYWSRRLLHPCASRRNAPTRAG
jgi:hypothetical protein